MKPPEELPIPPAATEPKPERRKDFGPEFFNLQLQFAARVRQLKPELSFSDVLMTYTDLYRRIGLSKPRDPNNPTWKAFVAEMETSPDPAQTAYKYHHARPEAQTEPGGTEVIYLDLFKYTVSGEVVELHTDSLPAMQGVGLANIRSMLREKLIEALHSIKTNFPNAKYIRGMSWLMSNPIFKKLFPPGFVASVKSNTTSFTGLSRWGQFVNADKKLKSDKAQLFLDKLQSLTPDDLSAAFPEPSLQAEGDLEEFYKFYGIE